MRIVVFLVFAAVAASSCATDDRPVRDRIRAEVEAARTPEYATRSKDARHLWTATKDFYRARAFAPVWLHQRRASAEMEALLAAVKRADRDGLDPLLYDIAFVDERGGNGRKRFSEEDAGQVDVRLTFTYLQFASDLADGVWIWRRRIRPGTGGRERSIRPRISRRRSPMARSPNHSTPCGRPIRSTGRSRRSSPTIETAPARDSPQTAPTASRSRSV